MDKIEGTNDPFGRLGGENHFQIVLKTHKPDYKTTDAAGSTLLFPVDVSSYAKEVKKVQESDLSTEEKKLKIDQIINRYEDFIDLSKYHDAKDKYSVLEAEYEAVTGMGFSGSLESLVLWKAEQIKKEAKETKEELLELHRQQYEYWVTSQYEEEMEDMSDMFYSSKLGWMDEATVKLRFEESDIYKDFVASEAPHTGRFYSSKFGFIENQEELQSLFEKSKYFVEKYNYEGGEEQMQMMKDAWIKDNGIEVYNKDDYSGLPLKKEGETEDEYNRRLLKIDPSGELSWKYYELLEKGIQRHEKTSSTIYTEITTKELFDKKPDYNSVYDAWLYDNVVLTPDQIKESKKRENWSNVIQFEYLARYVDIALDSEKDKIDFLWNFFMEFGKDIKPTTL